MTKTFIATVEIPDWVDEENVYHNLTSTARIMGADVPEFDPKESKGQNLNTVGTELQEEKGKHAAFREEVRYAFTALKDRHGLESSEVNEILDSLGLDRIEDKRTIEVTMTVALEVSGTNIDWDFLEEPDVDGLAERAFSFGDGITVEGVDRVYVRDHRVIDSTR